MPGEEDDDKDRDADDADRYRVHVVPPDDRLEKVHEQNENAASATAIL
jgi:hypothetical protein